MKKSSFILLVFIASFAISCGPENSTNNIHAEKIEKKDSVQVDKHQLECMAHWDSIMRKDSLKVDYFIQHIMPDTLDADMPTSNKIFLQALNISLSKDFQENAKQSIIEYPLSPILKIEGQLGVFKEPEYGTIDGGTMDITKEYEQLLASGYFKTREFGNDEWIYFPKIFNALMDGKSKELYIYTDRDVKKSPLVNFGFYDNECTPVYIYSFNTKPFKKDDHILFASPYLLELEYGTYPDVDFSIHKQYRRDCQDCPHSNHISKSFAKLKGTNDLYFMYADSFPDNRKVDYPYRSLVMKMNDGYFVDLWYDGMDTFGCSCL